MKNFNLKLCRNCSHVRQMGKRGERGQAETRFSLQVTDLAPVKGEGKDVKLSRNNSDHSAAPREPWQSPKVLVQRTLLS